MEKARRQPAHELCRRGDRDQVYVFDYKPRGTSIKVKNPLRIWDWHSGPRPLHPGEGRRNGQHLPGGAAGPGTIHIESGKMPGSTTEYNAPVLDLLGI